MGYLRVERLLQILQDGSSSYHTTLQMVDTKAFERSHIKVLEELLMSRLLSKHPIVHLVGTETRAKVAFEVVATLSVVEYLLRLEVTHQLLHVVVGTLTRQELTCRDIEEADATGALAKVYCTKKVVLFVVEHRIAHCHTRCHQFRDTSLDEFLRQLRVFQLVTDGHSSASTNQLRQVGVEGMMWKARHLVALVIPIIAMRQRDAQYLRRNDSILAIRLVEVTTTKQQQGLRVLRLKVEKLLHHWCQLLCHRTSLN